MLEVAGDSRQQTIEEELRTEERRQQAREADFAPAAAGKIVANYCPENSFAGAECTESFAADTVQRELVAEHTFADKLGLVLPRRCTDFARRTVDSAVEPVRTDFADTVP